MEMSGVATKGSLWTWCNGRKGKGRICEWLDRFIANKSWKDLFPRAEATNCGFFGSDHRAVKLLLNFKQWRPKNPAKKGFMFENKWMMEEGFLAVVGQGWNEANRMETFPEKLDLCGNRINKWVSAKVGNTNQKIKQVLNEIDRLKGEEGNGDDVKTLEKEAEKLMLQEEMYWHQRAKKKLVEGGR